MNSHRDSSVGDRHVSRSQVERRVRFPRFYDTIQYRNSVTSLKPVRQTTNAVSNKCLANAKRPCDCRVLCLRLWLVGKPVVDFIFVLIELFFAISYG